MRIDSGLVSGQVLQRVKGLGSALLKGAAENTGPVLATLTKGGRSLAKWSRREVGRAARGKFSAELSGLPTGGPYKLTLEVAREKVSLAEIFVGDVWLMAGQSNMQGIGNLSGAAKPDPLIRCLYMDAQWRRAEEPLHLLPASPDPVHSPNGPTTYALARQAALREGKGTGVGLFFAKEMLKRTRGVPQGLITCAHGGTTMAQWDPAKKGDGGKSLYGSMLKLWRPTGQKLAGVLWYQGESDCGPGAANVYTEKMQALVAAMRKDFDTPGLPFLCVQLGCFTTAGGGAGPWWEWIRDQQLRLAKKIPNFALSSAIDLALDDPIHIGADGYTELGRRMARQAARLALGDRKEKPEPVPAKVTLKKGAPVWDAPANVVEVRFDHVVGGLRAPDRPNGFVLVSMDGAQRASQFRVTLHKDTVRVFTEPNMGPGTVALLYGPGANPYCNITDGRGAPLPAFGPVYFRKDLHAITPFLPVCDATEVQLPVAGGIASLDFPKRGTLPAHRADSISMAGFINENPHWEGKPGWAAFHFNIDCTEAMPVKIMLGYDGPFRFAIDGQEKFRDLNGTNPAVADRGLVEENLPAGRHEACILMDTNGGKAWGFWFRMARTDIPAERVPKRDFAMPIYST